MKSKPPPQEQRSEFPLSAHLFKASLSMSSSGDPCKKLSMKTAAELAGRELSEYGQSAHQNFQDLPSVVPPGDFSFASASQDVGRLVANFKSALEAVCTTTVKAPDISTRRPIACRLLVQGDSDVKQAAYFVMCVSGNSKARAVPLRLTFILCETMGEPTESCQGLCFRLSAMQRVNAVKLPFVDADPEVGRLCHHSLESLCGMVVSKSPHATAVKCDMLEYDDVGLATFQASGLVEGATCAATTAMPPAKRAKTRDIDPGVDWTNLPSKRERSQQAMLPDRFMEGPVVDELLAILGDDERLLGGLEESEGDGDSSGSDAASDGNEALAGASMGEITESLGYELSRAWYVIPCGADVMRSIGKIRMMGGRYMKAECSTHGQSRCTLKVDCEGAVDDRLCLSMLWCISGTAMGATDHIEQAAQLTRQRRATVAAAKVAGPERR